jgi:hypothetical protein
MFSDQSKKQAALQACEHESSARKYCYESSGKCKGGEDCLIEELTEKRCLAFGLCPAEARAYYGEREGIAGKGLCSLWAEAFAFTRDDARGVDENTREAHTRASEIIMADQRRKGAACRERAHNLTKCLANFQPFE